MAKMKRRSKTSPHTNDRLNTVFRDISRNLVRLRLPMSQVTLAQKAGVSRSTLHKVETGEGCSLEVLVWLADALGVDPADLFITQEQARALNYMTLKLLERLSEQLKK